VSRQPCVSGESWGYNDHGIWVSHGCRADFAVGPGGYRDRYRDDGNSMYVDSSGHLVHCIATDSGRTYCGGRHAGYTYSGAPNPNCIEGQTWGYDDRGVWVSGQCNGDFAYVDADGVTASTAYVDTSGRLVHCVSTISGRTYCGTHHVRYSLSGNPNPYCVQGQTWGYDERGVWVSGQCVGDFAYYDTDEDETRTTYVDNSGRLVHCVSTISGRTYCGTRHVRYSLSGNPNPYCIQGQTWGFDERGVWVSGRCVGDFAYYDDDDNRSTTYVDSSGQLVHCVSTVSGRTYCGTRHARYTLSGNPNPYCVQGQTWGYDERGVWVSGQCRGDFAYFDADDVAGRTTYVASTGHTIHCVAEPNGRTYCGAHHVRYALYGNPNPYCVQGQTWGYDERGVWVSGQCVGDFRYYDSDD
jgi:hypothetical protein